MKGNLSKLIIRKSEYYIRNFYRLDVDNSFILWNVDQQHNKGFEIYINKEPKEFKEFKEFKYEEDECKDIDVYFKVILLSLASFVNEVDTLIDYLYIHPKFIFKNELKRSISPFFPFIFGLSIDEITKDNLVIRKNNTTLGIESYDFDIEILFKDREYFIIEFSSWGCIKVNYLEKYE